MSGRYRRFASWVVVGVAGALVELVLLKSLYEGLLWPLPVATAVAAEALILGKFVVSDRWVFNHPAPTLERLVKYHGASAGAFAVYWLVINGLSELMGVPYVIAFVLGTGAAFCWSLFTNFFWVWARPA